MLDPVQTTTRARLHCSSVQWLARHSSKQGVFGTCSLLQGHPMERMCCSESTRDGDQQCWTVAHAIHWCVLVPVTRNTAHTKSELQAKEVEPSNVVHHVLHKSLSTTLWARCQQHVANVFPLAAPNGAAKAAVQCSAYLRSVRGVAGKMRKLVCRL